MPSLAASVRMLGSLTIGGLGRRLCCARPALRRLFLVASCCGLYCALPWTAAALSLCFRLGILPTVMMRYVYSDVCSSLPDVSVLSVIFTIAMSSGFHS